MKPESTSVEKVTDCTAPQMVSGPIFSLIRKDAMDEMGVCYSISMEFCAMTIGNPTLNLSAFTFYVMPISLENGKEPGSMMIKNGPKRGKVCFLRSIKQLKMQMES